MNTNILRKCLEELNKEDPRKDYVIGMLETLIDSQNNSQTIPLQQYQQFSQNNPPLIPDMNQFPIINSQEADLARAYGSGPVAVI